MSKEVSMGKRVKDLTDQRFSRLVVKEFAGLNERGKSLWKCLCNCKTEKIISGSELCRGHIKSCGCTWHEIKNRTGKRYGCLTVMRFADYNQYGKSLWLCKCDCGKEVIVGGCELHSGNTKSCGCSRIKHGKYIKAIFDLKKECRKESNYICQECRKTQKENLEELGVVLDVHHIDLDDSNNVMRNLFVLCHSCHTKLHHKIRKLEKELTAVL